MKNNDEYYFELLTSYLGLIKDDNLRDFTKFVLENAPNVFFHLPASTTGKHHPNYALGEGGLVRHVIAVVKIADSLLNLEMYNFNEVEKDLILSALFLHDCVKTGFTDDINEHTAFEHPLLSCSLITKCYETNTFSLSEDLVNNLKRLISSHMGQWNTDADGIEILPKPILEDEKFVHLCDYLASKKFIEINFYVEDK